jgi:hypothetical protein
MTDKRDQVPVAAHFDLNPSSMDLVNRHQEAGNCALCCGVAMLFLPSRNGGHNVLGNRLLVLGRTEES